MKIYLSKATLLLIFCLVALGHRSHHDDDHMDRDNDSSDDVDEVTEDDLETEGYTYEHQEIGYEYEDNENYSSGSFHVVYYAKNVLLFTWDISADPQETTYLFHDILSNATHNATGYHDGYEYLFNTSLFGSFELTKLSGNDTTVEVATYFPLGRNGTEYYNSEMCHYNSNGTFHVEYYQPNVLLFIWSISDDMPGTQYSLLNLGTSLVHNVTNLHDHFELSHDTSQYGAFDLMRIYMNETRIESAYYSPIQTYDYSWNNTINVYEMKFNTKLLDAQLNTIDLSTYETKSTKQVSLVKDLQGEFCSMGAYYEYPEKMIACNLVGTNRTSNTADFKVKVVSTNEKTQQEVQDDLVAKSAMNIYLKVDNSTFTVKEFSSAIGFPPKPPSNFQVTKTSDDKLFFTWTVEERADKSIKTESSYFLKDMRNMLSYNVTDYKGWYTLSWNTKTAGSFELVAENDFGYASSTTSYDPPNSGISKKYIIIIVIAIIILCILLVIVMIACLISHWAKTKSYPKYIPNSTRMYIEKMSNRSVPPYEEKPRPVISD